MRLDGTIKSNQIKQNLFTVILIMYCNNVFLVKEEKLKRKKEKREKRADRKTKKNKEKTVTNGTV